MADAYIDATYVKAQMGTGVHDAIAAVTGSSITQRIESATALVQAAMRAQGYAVATTTTDELVKLAVLWAFWTLAASNPETTLALPDNWQEHPARDAYRSIKDGTAELPAAPSARAAIGGWTWSDNDPDTEDTRAPRATRTELEGW